MARLAGAACALVALCGTARAIMVNQYTFNDGTLADSLVSGQPGILVDNTGIARIAAGAVDLTANNNSSNQNFALPTTVGAFVDLPNGLIQSAVGGDGQISLEIWFTTQQNRNWAEVYSFGAVGTGDAEGTSEGGADRDYIALIPNSDPAAPALDDFRATTHISSNAETPIIGQATPLSVGVKHHVVLTIDMLDTSAGTTANGTAKLYLNNGAPVAALNRPALDLMVDVNNWLGRSPWPDPLFDGTIDEFRIYDQAMTPADVAASFTAGPVPAPPGPTLVIDRSTGAISLANQAGAAFNIKSYTITSAAGALDPLTWTSIDADNTFDPDGAWTKTTSTNLQLTETNTGGATDGGTIAVSATRGIGTPWRRSPTEDLVFSYMLGNNTTGFGVVQFTGNGGVPLGRSDFTGDGDVTVADWNVFLANAFTNFPAETAVGAYLKGDLDADKDNDYLDFLRFKADYIASNGVAAFEALNANVPEPGAMALAAMAALAVTSVRRRRRS